MCTYVDYKSSINNISNLIHNLYLYIYVYTTCNTKCIWLFFFESFIFICILFEI
jgi:hypothetical protein